MLNRTIGAPSLVAAIAVVGAAAMLTGCGSGPSNADTNARPQDRLLLPPEEDARTNAAVAQSLEDGGAFREAIQHYERARSLAPDKYQWVARRLAVLYDKVGDSFRAKREYDNAFRLTPNDANLNNDMGYFFLTRNELDKAEEHFRRAVEIDPKNARAWNNLGVTLAEKRQYEEAYEAFVEVLSPAEARVNLSVILARQGQFDQAERELEWALTQQPDLERYGEVLEFIRAQRAGADPDAVPGGEQTREW